MLISKIMENYKILNPEMAPAWALLEVGSVLTAIERVKAPDISYRLQRSVTSVSACLRNEPSRLWGTNIAICTRIGQGPELVMNP